MDLSKSPNRVGLADIYTRLLWEKEGIMNFFTQKQVFPDGHETGLPDRDDLFGLLTG